MTSCGLLLALMLISGGEKMRVQIFFEHDSLERVFQFRHDPSATPVGVYPVDRFVSSSAPARESVIELLRGPTDIERARGYSTNLDNLRLTGISLKEGVASVRLNGVLRLRGTFSGARLRAQVDRTLLQFPSIRRVLIWINNKPDFDSSR